MYSKNSLIPAPELCPCAVQSCGLPTIPGTSKGRSQGGDQSTWLVERIHVPASENGQLFEGEPEVQQHELMWV